MKRKMSKKVLCLCMVAVLAIGLAIPTFADAGTARGITNARVFRFQGSAGYALSAGVSGTDVVQNSNVCIDSYRSGAYRQQWLLQTTSNGCFIILSREGQGSNLALNVNHSTNNCNLYPYTSNDFSDYAVFLESAGNSMYYVKLFSSGLSLYATNTSGGNAYWGARNAAPTWYLQV